MKTPWFDIFQVQGSGVLSVGSKTTLEEADKHVRQTAGGATGEYIFLNQKTRARLVIKFNGGDSTGPPFTREALRDSQ